MSRRAFVAAACVALCTSTFSSVSPAQGRSATAQFDELKVAFLLQFANYVTWPETAFEEADSPLVICVHGNDNVFEMLTEKAKGRAVEGRSIKVVRHDADKDTTCHIAFVDEASGDSGKHAEEHFGKGPVLTVGDSDDFTRTGGIIRLYIADAKPRLEINVKAAEAADLRISSKLLRLATIYDS